MKSVAKVVMLDKQAEATANLLFEDIYNWLDKWRDQTGLAGKELERTIIDKVVTGVEGFDAYIWAHCTKVKDAAIYVWGIRKRTTIYWSEWWSSSNEVTFRDLLFSTEYEFRVKAYGIGFIQSPWSPIVIWLSAAAPKPSMVTGIVITDETLYVDPTTGVTLASVKVEWTNNAASEFVDSYEVLWY